MDRYEFLIAMMGILMTGGVTTALIVTVGRVIAQRKAPPSLPPGSVAQLDERLSRMEQAIDAMAVEMERVSEGQRFTSKLLADRTAEPVRDRPSR
jgi:hypothetical protein